MARIVIESVFLSLNWTTSTVLPLLLAISLVSPSDVMVQSETIVPMVHPWYPR